MMKILLAVFVAIATVLAEEKEEVKPAARSIVLPGPTRYNNCQYETSYNPCANNPLNRLNFPHPSDPTKFIQCGTYGRKFIVQCPPNEVYDQATTTCVNKFQIINPPILAQLTKYGVTNPCTQQNILVGRIFFSLLNHVNNFIQCEPNGNAKVLACPAQTVWDQARMSCVYPEGANLVGTVTLTALTGVAANPCTAQAIQVNALFFSHPDPSKFIQCDLQGNAFVQNCPAGLVWNQFLETCVSQLASYTFALNRSNQ